MTHDKLLKNMMWVPGGTFLMGSDDFYPVPVNGRRGCGLDRRHRVSQVAPRLAPLPQRDQVHPRSQPGFRRRSSRHSCNVENMLL
jgi:hypothetical protein